MKSERRQQISSQLVTSHGSLVLMPLAHERAVGNQAFKNKRTGLAPCGMGGKWLSLMVA